MNTLQPQTEDGFKSGFKAWIRVVAFVIVAVFLPEQFAQAIEYDPRVLWRGAKAGMLTPTSMLQSVPAMDIPLAVKTILTDLSGKQVNAVRFSSNLTVTLDKPLNLSKEKIEEIYSWLKGRPCGSKALYDLLAYKGIRAEEQDIAVMALSIDILNDVVKPEGNPEVIKNSLFALSKTSEFFGLKLYPVKINPEDLADNTPFIAHLNGGHYVLVTKVADGKVYVADEHKEDYLPAEKFLQEFSGYSLVAKAAVQAVLSDKEAQGIMGARSRRGEDFDWGKWATNLGITVGTSVVLSGIQWGSTAKQGGTIANDAFHVAGKMYYQLPTMTTVGQGLTNAFLSYSINKAVVNVGQLAGWNTSTSRILSSTLTGAALGSVGGIGNFISGSSTIADTANITWGGAIGGAASGFVYGGVSELARKQGVSDSLASFAGLVPSMFTAAAFNAANGAYAKIPEGVNGSYTTYQSNQWLAAAFDKGIYENRNYLIANAATIGVEEVLRRTTNIDPAYNSMIGAGMRVGMSSYLGGKDASGMEVSLNQAITRGLIEGGVSYLTAGFEKSLGFDNPFMESFVASTLTAGVRGLFTDSVMGSITKNWQETGLRTLTVGYYNHDQSFAGEAAYFTNVLDWSYNAAYSGFAQAMVQYATDTYHYSAVNNIIQTMQFSSTLANLMGLPQVMQNYNDKKLPGLVSLNKLPGNGFMGTDQYSLLDPDNPFNKSAYDQLKDDLKGKGLFRDFGFDEDSDLEALLNDDNKKPEDLLEVKSITKAPISDVTKDIIKSGRRDDTFDLDAFNFVPDMGIRSTGEIIIKAGSELLINPKTGEILPGSKITGWDIKSLTEYPNSLKVLVSTYETVNGTGVVPAGVDKLGALVSSYNNDLGVSAALLQLKAKSGNMIQVDRSE
ncbi:MAG: cysteine peptidase family C39 domain-containing protein, partial [Candidatus Omnitrophica bacterium]|nr:cysteine peptidase family C39 domain-containing protein [Candidatus Omnitrophota bacterium]